MGFFDKIKQRRLEKNAKILLVMPSYNQCVKSLFVFHEDQAIGFKPPLGLLSIATYAKSKGFTEVEVLDATLENMTPEETALRIIEKSPRIIGFSCMTDVWYNVCKTISLVRRALPDSLIIVGGAHASIYPELSLRASDADIAIAGDGEIAFLLTLDSLCNGRWPTEIDGVFWKDSDGSIYSPLKQIAIVENYDNLPSPDRTLVNLNKYNSLLSKNRTTTMITSRGCPYNCVFCKVNFQKVISRSPALVVEEFGQIAKSGFTNVEVCDDTFTWSKDRVLQICNGIIKEQIKIKWSVRSRVDKVDEEVLLALKKAGCKRIHFGIESGNAKVLQASKKSITIEECRSAVRLAKKIGLIVLTYYMIGFIDEALNAAEDTFRFAMELDPYYAVFAVLIPYPGTAIYEQALKRRIICSDYWLEFTKNPVPDYIIPHLSSNLMTRDEMIQFVNRAHFKFYWRPERLISELFCIRSLEEFLKRSDMGFRLLKHYFTKKAKIK